MLLVALVVFGGCRARATVTVRLDDEGSGQVAARLTLDRDAVAAIVGLGDTLDTAVRLDGFVEAGWDVEPWDLDSESGRAVLVLRKEFVGADELDAVLGELGGDLVKVDTTIDRDRAWLSSKDAVAIEVDARDLAVRVGDDAEMTALLSAAGFDVAASDEERSADLRRSLRLDLRLMIPGDESQVTLQPGESVVLEAESSSSHLGRLVAVAFGGVSVVVGLGLVVLVLRR